MRRRPAWGSGGVTRQAARQFARRLAALCGLALAIGSAALARAASPAQVVDWEAPEGCPGAREVYDRLQRSLGDAPEPLREPARMRGVVVGTARGYRLVLELLQGERRSSRTLEAQDCNELVDAAVLAATLALVDARAREGVGLAVEPVAADLESLARPTTEPPPPRTSSAGAVLAPEATASASVLGGFLSVGALMEIGALPHDTAGLDLGGGLRRGPLTLAAHGALLASNRLNVGPDESIELGLWLAGLRGCYAPIEAPFLRLDVCGGLQVGRYRAAGIALQSAREVEDTWFAPESSLAVAFPVSSAWSLTPGVSVAFPVSRHRYTVNASELVHAPAWASVTFYLTVVLTSGAERPALR